MKSNMFNQFLKLTKTIKA